jgi:hypothetical protein
VQLHQHHVALSAGDEAPCRVAEHIETVTSTCEEECDPRRRDCGNLDSGPHTANAIGQLFEVRVPCSPPKVLIDAYRPFVLKRLGELRPVQVLRRVLPPWGHASHSEAVVWIEEHKIARLQDASKPREPLRPLCGVVGDRLRVKRRCGHDSALLHSGHRSRLMSHDLL